jgi:hypothetical protein
MDDYDLKRITGEEANGALKQLPKLMLSRIPVLFGKKD